MSNTYLCAISSRLQHLGSLSQLVGLMTQGSLLPICLSFSRSLRSLSMLERVRFQPMTQLQQIREKQKERKSGFGPNNAKQCCRQDNSLLWDPPTESSFSGQIVSP